MNWRLVAARLTRSQGVMRPEPTLVGWLRIATKR